MFRNQKGRLAGLVATGLFTAFVATSVMLVHPGTTWGDTGAGASRVALVIGNGAYGSDIGRLKNPTNDAKLIAATLRELGFKVRLETDVDQKDMKRAIRDFGQDLEEAGTGAIGLFYYAGHGVQVNGVNYLLPIGAEIEREADVEVEAVSAQSVLAQMEFAPNGVDLVFLDACRNNPLTRGFRSSSRGLARVDAPRGSFVGYSTAPGDISVDGEGDNSPYTLALAEELRRPGASIEEVHRAVRMRVLSATNNAQTPWDSSSLTAHVVLTPAQADVGQKTELLFWETAQASNSAEVFEDYLRQFPNGVFVSIARARLAQLRGQAEPPLAAQPTTAEQVASAPAAVTQGLVDLAGTYTAVKTANIRAAPSTEARIVAKLERGSTVAATGATSDRSWLRVEGAFGEGYVSGPLLQEVPRQESPLPAAPVQSAALPAPAPDAAGNILRLAANLRGDVERYLANSATNTTNFRFLAVNRAGDRIGVSTACKQHKTGWGGWGVEMCSSEDEARRIAVQTCGDDCRVIFRGDDKIGDFEIAWVTPGETSDASAVMAEAAATPIVTASAPASEPAGAEIIRVDAALRPQIEQFIDNSREMTLNYRFLAINGAGTRIGTSTACKINRTGWGGWGVDGCDSEDAARRIALSACGGDCRIIFKGPDPVGRFELLYQ